MKRISQEILHVLKDSNTDELQSRNWVTTYKWTSQCGNVTIRVLIKNKRHFITAYPEVK
jgi:hypothetical protein